MPDQKKNGHERRRFAKCDSYTILTGPFVQWAVHRIMIGARRISHDEPDNCVSQIDDAWRCRFKRSRTNWRSKYASVSSTSRTASVRLLTLPGPRCWPKSRTTATLRPAPVHSTSSSLYKTRRRSNRKNSTTTIALLPSTGSISRSRCAGDRRSAGRRHCAQQSPQQGCSPDRRPWLGPRQLIGFRYRSFRREWSNSIRTRWANSSASVELPIKYLHVFL